MARTLQVIERWSLTFICSYTASDISHCLPQHMDHCDSIAGFSSLILITTGRRALIEVFGVSS